MSAYTGPLSPDVGLPSPPRKPPRQSPILLGLQDRACFFRLIEGGDPKLMPEKHDGSYRLLFSHPRMVEDLLRGFLPLARPPGTLERRSEVYLSDQLERREPDLVWRLRGPQGEPVVRFRP